jgi:hypothetical protein
MPFLIVDDRGEIRDAASRAGGLESGDRETAPDRPVLDSRFIAMEETGETLRVRLMPAEVSPIALSALRYHLADRRPVRIAISWLEGVWKSRLFGSRQDAIRHLLSVVPQKPHRTGDFMSRTRCVQSLSCSSTLGFIASLWRADRQPIKHEQLARVLRDELKGRYIVIQADQNKTLYFRDVGSGFPWLEQHWVTRARGLRMQDQPDYFLGGWAAETYRAALVAGEPRLDDVDAITTTPKVSRARIRYTRLIVPVATQWGEHCLLGATVINSDIDLRA